MNTPLKTNQYTISWKEKHNPESAVFKFFLSHLADKNLKYWIPFLYNRRYYLMTFNNCYSVEVMK